MKIKCYRLPLVAAMVALLITGCGMTPEQSSRIQQTLDNIAALGQQSGQGQTIRCKKAHDHNGEVREFEALSCPFGWFQI